MSGATAWLMQIDRLSRVAVGQLELVHIIALPQFIDVPKAPKYCSRIILWNGKVLPVLDLSMLVKKTSAFSQNNSVAVAIYRDYKTSEIKYGGIMLADMPTQKQVYDNQAGLREELEDCWKAITVSSFKTEDDETVPILDLKRLFSPGIDKIKTQ